MRLIKFFLIVIAVVITSCYFFPFVPMALPMANSKMILALIGLIVFGFNLAKKNNALAGSDFLNLTLWAFGISLISFATMTINNTPDNTFATYFMSMWVWLGGAYAVVMFVKSVHGRVSIPLVVNYLLAVCIIQCILALIFNSIPGADEWHRMTFSGEGYMGNTEEDRLHGIGCSLDVAGFRFAAVLCMAAYLISSKTSDTSKMNDIFYIVAICFISVVGNMISRSTIIGTIIALVIIGIGVIVNRNTKLISKFSFILIVAVAICIFMYNTNSVFRSNIRFGFEGFFSLAEKGKWETNSNNILENMVVWPDNLKTWIIGDGYINNPSDINLVTYDPYFIGKVTGGYYMGTDIGYLRYIFYFGLTGLIMFCLFFIRVCTICMRRFEKFKWMFLLILAINFIQWFKVSTDLFLVFAPFLCISEKDNENFVKSNGELCENT